MVFACATWGSSWLEALVTTHIDNTAAVTILNSGYSKEGQIMHLVRCLFFIMAHFQFSLVARHIPGSQNTLADAISRNNVQSFFSQSLEMNTVPSVIHEALVELLVTEQPDMLGDPHMPDMPQLEYVIKGLQRKAVKGAARPRLPITPTLLGALKQVWSRDPDRFSASML